MESQQTHPADSIADRFIVVMVTTASEVEAQGIATALVNEGLAACVNFREVQSIYRWKGDTCHSREWHLFIKTKSAKFDALGARIQALHPYDVPEIIAVPIVRGAQTYLDWLDQET
ncbi:divalent-cation tolerance protein CutA [Candidatus Synechococcus calcipolaris G9]|uniref:Divalent-cation tolerance protein CutA n=1 Tax=Candidatus Synechococcus calcipolaris G9 TaxID=1497997 RepID=A0ABT6F1X2_9SYNE|nr:divalent-cation tolerance protein CutA [Candidatus Synechococcus calcipolaris]MDG2991860.1 divalent-cation tolerance protein CutA [Candidatus Synechococcus calcipolaris G9]